MTTRAMYSGLISAPTGTFNAISDVVDERARQERIGYTPEHDDVHGFVHLQRIAAAYLRGALFTVSGESVSIRALLVKAAASTIAAIEYLDRRAGRG